jgi:hypothetical protein
MTLDPRARRALFTAVATLALSACEAAFAPPPAATATASARVRWIRATAPRDASFLEAPARVVAAPEAEGRVGVLERAQVRAVLVRPGDTVRVDAPLVVLVVPELVRAAADLVAADAERALLVARLGELEGLRKEGLERRAASFDLERSLAALEARRTLALATLATHGVPRDEAPRLAERGTWTVRSPTAGVVATVRARVGEVVEAGAPPLVEVRGVGVARVEVTLGGKLAEVGALELVTPDGERHPLRWPPLAEVHEPEHGLRRLWFALADDARLPDGLLGRVRVLAAGADLAEVPSRALDRGADGVVHVHVETATGAAPRAVEVLATSGASALVRGLAPGTRVRAEPPITPAPEAD